MKLIKCLTNLLILLTVFTASGVTGYATNNLDRLDKTYQYDASQHLLGEYETDGTLIKEYIYLGNRTIARVGTPTTSTGAGTNTSYLFADSLEISDTGTIPNTEAVPAIVYLHNDIIGTPVVGTDEDGNILWQEQRRAYGQIATTSATPRNKSIYSVGYTGHQEDNDSGLTYAKARYYNPEIGRFYAPDPIDFRTNDLSSINRYVYGANNPYMYTDPTGECNMGTDYGINCTSYALVQGADVARTASHEWGHGNYGTSMVGYALWVGNLANVAYGIATDTVMSSGNATYNMVTGFTAGNYDQALLGSTELLLVGAGVKLTSVPAQAKATGDATKRVDTRVGRWMSPDELAKMKSTGTVQEGSGGLTFVANSGASSFRKQAKPGSNYVEFDVPTNSLLQGGKIDWFKTLGPNAPKSQLFKLNKQGGQANPPFRNLSDVIETK